MPKPKTKAELISASKKEYKALLSIIDEFPNDFAFQIPGLNRNIKDVITHLHHWHLLFISWHREALEGKKPEMPAKGYKWKDISKLNQEIWTSYQSCNLSEAKALFEKSFKDIMTIAESYSQEELFEKKRYFWTGSTSLAAYLISNTSSHYRWGIKIINRNKKLITT